MSTLEVIHPHCAGIDIGSTSYHVCALDNEVKIFGTYHEDCEQLVYYLESLSIEVVAMESTGVYWYHLYEVLDSAGFTVYLVNPRQTRQRVEGRKSDVQDAIWIRDLLRHGLLRNSFIPDTMVRELRTFARLRQDHVRAKAQQENLMNKALISMNVRISEALSSLTTVSGLKMMRAIVAGERDASVLLSLCDIKIIKNKSASVLKALKGNFNAGHIFTLKQALEAWDFYGDQINSCDEQMATCLDELGKSYQEEVNSKPKPSRTTNMPKIDGLHEKVVKCFSGTNPCELTGISDYSCVRLIAELGTDLSAWKDVKQFTSWLGLAPKSKQSGKMKKNVKSPPTIAGQIFKDAAAGLLNARDNPLGEIGRSIRARSGPTVAIKAMARRIAVSYYYLIKEGVKFVEKGVDQLRQKQEQKKLQLMQAWAKEMNYVEIVVREQSPATSS